jgi:hypothetical protein
MYSRETNEEASGRLVRLGWGMGAPVNQRRIQNGRGQVWNVSEIVGPIAAPRGGPDSVVAPRSSAMGSLEKSPAIKRNPGASTRLFPCFRIFVFIQVNCEQ